MNRSLKIAALLNAVLLAGIVLVGITSTRAHAEGSGLIGPAAGSSAGATARTYGEDPWNQRLYWSAPPCAQEDGSGQRTCVWDAKYRGNGRGHSLLNIDHRGESRYVRISHKRAHVLVKRWRQINCEPVTPRHFACTGWGFTR